ncbi:LPS-assembly lipoprotein RlpB precursor (Rare lipoprotein B) [Vibrio chagasii]|uniref:LPS-assembly lipoprotein LptE n=1 Tax=Vibrio chagasii TaxID=170679 RepID=UPI00337B2C92|nr:LPS-assembly lipoprotein RlpB precursor (Rare lipoprotein B) [Vibrio chagasii]CAH6889766.1 LPS-assembly lipoprotein RlpB precursor (Rare lipoprotein B) [Vibrio chagasii]CAH6897529.1 LPS-assembly lipoprotein RlpB precursor (Rare lipoprotein B) [Vibrio chagasii]CAH6901753.1 LPS-assembly lipoprotein RlpB precursor (Rare lipoprotein B) [Vibrio chagasii]CAH6940148.1 LPS-assembly lipoprotein RlpB precursor (Rare lipoprotein B) [Vibrio chagasii]
MRLISLSSLKVTIVVLTVSLLSACGFHLRGDYSVPEELNKISVTSYDQYSTFTRMMKGQLRMNDVEIVPPSENTPNLHIISESVGERTLSLYQNTRAAEKELTFRASYRVTIPDLGAKTFSTSVTRSYLDNPLTALAKSVERDMIEDEMRKLATSQILRQMARLKANIAAGSMNLESLETVQVKELEKQYNIKNVEIDDVEIEPSTEQQPELSESAQ